MFFTPAPHYIVPTTMIDVIKHLGLTDGLKLCLDAGDANSYASGQKWLDTSGGGHDFFRGSTSSAQSSDPAFNGVAGQQSSEEYWSFDGGDYFTLDSVNPSWMNNLHKNNAIYSVCGYASWGNSADPLFLFSTVGGSWPTRGIWVRVSATSSEFGVTVHTGTRVVLNVDAGPVISTGQMYFFGITVNEATGAGSVVVNDTVATLGSVAYSSPETTNTVNPAMVGAASVDFPSSAGSKIANCCAWEGVALTTSDLTRIFNATRTKQGI